jgi:hypothetical protein
MEHIRQERQQLEIQRLLKREASRKVYKKLGKLLHPYQNIGLNRVDVPDNKAASPATGNPNDPKSWTGPWKTIMNPTELAKIVRDINRKQYHQAHNTPFGSGPLAQQAGRQGDTTTALELLNGTLPSSTSSLLLETQRILHTLAREHPTLQHSPVSCVVKPYGYLHSD